jgi:hypothetical protein
VAGQKGASHDKHRERLGPTTVLGGGAMLGGHALGDMYETFVKRGYWDYGYPDPYTHGFPEHAQYDKEHPREAALRNQIRKGDRIAIKAMLGQGAKEIRIRAIGIVKDNDQLEGRVYVNWLLKEKDMERKVPARGCLGIIHGPFAADSWIGEIFRI